MDRAEQVKAGAGGVVFVRRRVPVDRGVQAVCDRLVEQRDEIERLERRLAAARRSRMALIVKLRRAGLSLRTIAPLAGVTCARISQMGHK